MPGMIPDANNAPWYAPGRPFIVSDPTKLSYFARANAIRAGVQSMPGALQGVAIGDGDWANPYSGDTDGPGADRAFTPSSQFYTPTVYADARVLPHDVTAGSWPATAANVETPSGGSSLDSFFNAFNKLVGSAAPSPYGPPVSVAPSPWPWVIGAGVIGIGLLVLAKKRA